MKEEEKRLKEEKDVCFCVSEAEAPTFCVPYLQRAVHE